MRILQVVYPQFNPHFLLHLCAGVLSSLQLSVTYNRAVYIASNPSKLSAHQGHCAYVSISNLRIVKFYTPYSFTSAALYDARALMFMTPPARRLSRLLNAWLKGGKGAMKTKASIVPQSARRIMTRMDCATDPRPSTALRNPRHARTAKSPAKCEWSCKRTHHPSTAAKVARATSQNQRQRC